MLFCNYTVGLEKSLKEQKEKQKINKINGIVMTLALCQ